eukprot:2865953-Rhodomonas_salina.1
MLEIWHCTHVHRHLQTRQRTFKPAKSTPQPQHSTSMLLKPPCSTAVYKSGVDAADLRPFVRADSIPRVLQPRGIAVDALLRFAHGYLLRDQKHAPEKRQAESQKRDIPHPLLRAVDGKGHHGLDHDQIDPDRGDGGDEVPPRRAGRESKQSPFCVSLGRVGEPQTRGLNSC